MAVVVTGGAGFIGSMLCRKLVEQGRDVVVIDNLRNGRRELIDALKPSPVLHVADIRDAETVRRILAEVRPSALCHLAALHFIPYCDAHPAEAVDVNIRGTLNVLEACRIAPPEMVVVASTAAVYPIREGPNAESHPVGPLDIYGITKHCNEELAGLYVSQTGARCIAARIFNAVGVNETNPHLVPHLVQQLKRGQTRVSLGNLDSYRDYIDTRDLADGLIALLDRRQNGYDVFNIGTSREHSVREIVGMCGEILQRPIEIEQRSDLMRNVDRKHLCACIDKIAQATGWRPRIELRETLRVLLTES